jgi:hypothetical protein
MVVLSVPFEVFTRSTNQPTINNQQSTINQHAGNQLARKTRPSSMVASGSGRGLQASMEAHDSPAAAVGKQR